MSQSLRFTLSQCPSVATWAMPTAACSKLLRGLLALGCVPLGSPGPHQGPVFYDTGQVVQEVLNAAVTVDLLRLGVGQSVAGADKVFQVLDVLRYRGGE